MKRFTIAEYDLLLAIPYPEEYQGLLDYDEITQSIATKLAQLKPKGYQA